jgi:hypothetical protein
MGQVRSRHENFFSRQPRDVHICTKEEAEDILARAEHVDNYRSECATCRLNAAARTGQDYSPRPPTADVVPFLTAIEKFPQWLKDYLPPILYIVFLANSADTGMPHTRQPNIICLPQHFDITSSQGQATFMHECIHVHQRTFPDLWDRIYADVFHLEPYRGTLPDNLESRRRFNPDTFKTPYYMWKRRWVALPIFSNTSAPSLGSIKIAYYNVKSGAWQSFIPPEMENFFGELSVAQAEHPNELVAYWLATPNDNNQSNTLYNNLQTLIEQLSNDEYM